MAHTNGHTRRAWVVVLGDFGRSPRMQNHAKSLCQQVCKSVDGGMDHWIRAVARCMPTQPHDRHPVALDQHSTVGLAGGCGGISWNQCSRRHYRKPKPDHSLFTRHVCEMAQHINVCANHYSIYTPHRPALINRMPRAVRMVLKATWQLLTMMLCMLLRFPSPDIILLQVMATTSTHRRTAHTPIRTRMYPKLDIPTSTRCLLPFPFLQCAPLWHGSVGRASLWIGTILATPSWHCTWDAGTPWSCLHGALSGNGGDRHMPVCV